MQTEEINSRNIEESIAVEKKEEGSTKREFGLPAGLVSCLEQKGMRREEIAKMPLEEVLAKAGRLEGKALNKTIQTVLKTTRKPESLRERLEILTGRKTEEDVLESILGSVLYAQGLAPYAGGEEEFLEFVYCLATEAEHRNVKHAARFVLEHISTESKEIEALIAEKIDNFFPDTENLAPGEEDKMEHHIALFAGTRKSKETLREYVSARAEALIVLVRRSKGPLKVWKKLLGVYKKIEKASLPEEKMRTLGLGILKTLQKEEDIVEACAQYVQSMRACVHDFGYGQFFVSALQALPQSKETDHALEKLVIYALTETRGKAGSLCNMGISKIPSARLLCILEKVRPERLSLESGVPVVKQIARALKESPKELEVLEQYIEAVLSTRKDKRLGDLRAHIKESLCPAEEKAAEKEGAHKESVLSEEIEKETEKENGEA